MVPRSSGGSPLLSSTTFNAKAEVLVVRSAILPQHSSTLTITHVMLDHRTTPGSTIFSSLIFITFRYALRTMHSVQRTRRTSVLESRERGRLLTLAYNAAHAEGHWHDLQGKSKRQRGLVRFVKITYTTIYIALLRSEISRQSSSSPRPFHPTGEELRYRKQSYRMHNEPGTAMLLPARESRCGSSRPTSQQ